MIVLIKSQVFICGLLALLLAAQCKINSSTDKTDHDKFLKTSATKFDSVNEELIGQSELLTKDLIALKIVDTNLAPQLIETCYGDATIQLNDSIYYSIIVGNDEAGVCSHFFVASLNKKSKKVIASKFLYSDCDIDYAQDNYDVYEHKLISKGNIQVIKTTVFQKTNRTASNEEENIDHRQTRESYITVSQTGQITNPK